MLNSRLPYTDNSDKNIKYKNKNPYVQLILYYRFSDTLYDYENFYNNILNRALLKTLSSIQRDYLIRQR